MNKKIRKLVLIVLAVLLCDAIIFGSIAAMAWGTLGN